MIIPNKLRKKIAFKLVQESVSEHHVFIEIHEKRGEGERKRKERKPSRGTSF